jgi:hypothetical protein
MSRDIVADVLESYDYDIDRALSYFIDQASPAKGTSQPHIPPSRILSDIKYDSLIEFNGYVYTSKPLDIPNEIRLPDHTKPFIYNIKKEYIPVDTYIKPIISNIPLPQHRPIIPLSLQSAPSTIIKPQVPNNTSISLHQMAKQSLNSSPALTSLSKLVTPEITKQTSLGKLPLISGISKPIAPAVTSIQSLGSLARPQLPLLPPISTVQPSQPTKPKLHSSKVGQFLSVSYASPSTPLSLIPDAKQIESFKFDTPSPDDVVLQARTAAEQEQKKKKEQKKVSESKQKQKVCVIEQEQQQVNQLDFDMDALRISKTPSTQKLNASTLRLNASNASLSIPVSRTSSNSSFKKVPRVDVKAEFEKRKQEQKENLNLVVVGHVDAGKSTIMGHLLYLLEEVDDRKMKKFERDSERAKKGSFCFAWVLDETEEERARYFAIYQETLLFVPGVLQLMSQFHLSRPKLKNSHFLMHLDIKILSRI